MVCDGVADRPNTTWGRVWGPVSCDEEEVMDSRSLDQDVDVDQPRTAWLWGSERVEVGDVRIVRTAEAGREYMRGEEVKSVLNNDERSVIDKDRRRR